MMKLLRNIRKHAAYEAYVMQHHVAFWDWIWERLYDITHSSDELPEDDGEKGRRDGSSDYDTSPFEWS